MATDPAIFMYVGDVPRARFETTIAHEMHLVGPWYTVGWKMAVVIEKTFGRAALIDAFCDQRQLLPTYNRAAAEWNLRTGETLPLWSQELLDLLVRKSP